MSYEIRGILVKRGAKQEFGDFVKREIWVETEGQYPQTIALELQQNNIDLANSFAKDQLVSVKFNINGRTWQPEDGEEERCFNSLVAWKVDEIIIGTPRPQKVAAKPNVEPAAVAAAGELISSKPLDNAGTDDDPDDLPF